MTKASDWFVSWFDSNYYHILYQHRNYEEAHDFMRHLVEFLQLKSGSSLLDLACGKGRHSIYLNSLGYKVTGADLSKNSIKYAKQFENETLNFMEHDMRHPFKNRYDAIFNLFTSFGFFENDEEDIAVLKNIKDGLNKGGVAIIDFMNAKKTVNELIPLETQTLENIKFNIKRYVDEGFIIKEINFDADDQHHRYFEKVKCLDLFKIKSYLNTVGFKLKYTFGSYQLDPFNEVTSDRLILVLE